MFLNSNDWDPFVAHVFDRLKRKLSNDISVESLTVHEFIFMDARDFQRISNSTITVGSLDMALIEKAQAILSKQFYPVKCTYF